MTTATAGPIAVLAGTAGPDVPDALATRTLCTFRLADLHLGIDVTQVQEVIRRQELTPIPLVSSTLCGLINLRGEIVTAIDLRRRMGLGPRDDGETSMNVITRTVDGPVSLVVDEIDDVVDADPHEFEPPPPTLQGIRRSLVTGVFKLERGLLLLLDLDRVVDPVDIGAAAAVTPRSPAGVRAASSHSPVSPHNPSITTEVHS